MKSTSREIESLVAEHVAKIDGQTRYAPNGEPYYVPPRYLLQPDKVIKLLENEPNNTLVEMFYDPRTKIWGIGLRRLQDPDKYERGVDPCAIHERGDNFCRTACIALLKAHGVPVE